MHELGIASSILDIVREELARRGLGLGRLRRVDLLIGPMANVELEALRFAFAVLTERHVPALELGIAEEPVTLGCPACGVVAGEPWCVTCPRCGGPARPESGAALKVTSIEVDA